MRDEELKGALAFIGISILAGLFLFGFLIVTVILILLGLFLFLGFYLYVRLKPWREKRHPPKELESPEDYWR